MFGPILLTQNGIPELTLPNERHEHRIPASAWYLLEGQGGLGKEEGHVQSHFADPKWDTRVDFAQ